MGLSNSKSTEGGNEQFPTVWYHDFCQKELPSSALQDKTIVVTGCTSGTGLVFARTCIEKGAENVLLLNRPSERATQAERDLQQVAASLVNGESNGAADAATKKKACNVESIPCDLQSFDSVKQAAHAIQAKYPAVDVLCNNAGIMAVPAENTVDGYDVQMQTNHFSHFLLTASLFPLLQRAAELRGEARIVNHSSMARKGPALIPSYFQGKASTEETGEDASAKGGSGDSYSEMWKRYQQSKLANAVFTTALAQRLSQSQDERTKRIIATCAAPGYAATNLQVNSKGMNYAMWSRTLLAQSGQDGTMPLLAAAFLECRNGSFWNPLNRFGMVGPPGVITLEDNATNAESQKMLWEASEKACGIQFEIK